jgi:hypothetical protein
MRDEYWHAFFWVFVVASWAFGFAYGRWAGGGGAAGVGENLVGYWHLNGNANDSSSYYMHGTVHGGASWVSGEIGQALSLDGDNDYVDINAYTPSFSVTTWELWFKVNVSGASGTLISNDNGTGLGRPIFELLGGALRVGHFEPENDFDNIFTPAPDTWYHVAMVHSTSQIEVFVNGVSKGTVNGSYSTGTSDVEFGRRGSGAGYYFNGVIDEIRVYNRAFTASEILQHYQEGGGGFFSELGKAVSVPSPLEFNSWWQPLAYFTLTILAMFVLTQLFFGVGAAMFLFARGVSDSAVILALEAIVRKFPDFLTRDAWMLVLGMLILAVNLPLCIWSAHMGTQRTVYMWRRLRGQPMKPETTTKPIFNFLIVMAISIITGVVAAVAFSYAIV